MIGNSIELHSEQVLIDTWWNVNMICGDLKEAITRFNRYMVECK